MKLVSFDCPSCGARLDVDMDNRRATCPYCGARYSLDDEVRHIRYDNAEQAGYEFERGRQRAQAEYAQAMRSTQTRISGGQEQSDQKPTAQPKKRRTWLWVLGWLLVFPIPLTMLVLRNKRLGNKLRIGIVVIAWLAYLFLVVPWEGTPSDGSDTGAGAAASQAADTADEGALTEQHASADSGHTPSVLDESPSEEFVVARLSEVDHVQSPTPATADNDPNGHLGEVGHYTAAVFFASDLVDPREMSGSEVLERGTKGGGCVEVYGNATTAQRRDNYLSKFDGMPISAGYHTVVGTCVIRTSELLSEAQHEELEAAIIAALTRKE